MTSGVSIQITASAAERVRYYLREENLPEDQTALVIGIRPDFTYSLDLQSAPLEQQPPGTVSVMLQGLWVVVQASAAAQLDGLVVDYARTHAGEGFVFRNVEHLGGGASDPGRLSLSEAKLREIQPELFEDSWGDWDAQALAQARRAIADQLMEGDSRAAIVVSAKPPIVAAYSDDFDWALLLHFPPGLSGVQSLRVGDRLLCVNTYRREAVMAADLQEGPRSTHLFQNFCPLIAEFLSDDVARIEKRKSGISATEWKRVTELGQQLLAARVLARDGRPMFSDTPQPGV